MLCLLCASPSNETLLSLYETTTDQVPEMPLSRKENSPPSLSLLSLIPLSLTKEENSSHTQVPVQRLIWGLLGFFHSASDFLPLPLFLSLYPSLCLFGFSPSLSPYALLFAFYFFLLRGDEEGKEIALDGGLSIHIFVSGQRRRQN